MVRLSLLTTLLLCASMSAPLFAANTDNANVRVGTNYSGTVDWSSEIPFVDAFRLARTWISQRTGASWGQGPALNTDAQGWVTRLDAGTWVDTPMLNFSAAHRPSGHYVCLYEGEGTIEFWGGSTVVSQTPGRIVVNVGSGNTVWLRISSVNPGNYIKNIRFILPGHEATYQSAPYNPQFLNLWKGMNTMRFMDWMDTNHSTISTWSQRPTPQYFSYSPKGVPVEVMVDLCNRLKINPWFCIPHLATDDYIQRFATYVRDNLDPTLHVYIELSNEVWNGQFAQATYARTQGLAAGLSTNSFQAQLRWYSQRSVQMFSLWGTAFGGTDRLVRVMASQAANPWVSEQVLGWNNAAQSTDALAIAPYFSMNLNTNSNPSSTTVAAWSVDQVLDYLGQNSIPQAATWMRNQKQEATANGVRLIAYEGGQHAVGTGSAQSNNALTQVLTSANRHARMGTLYTAYMNEWLTQTGGDLFANYSSVGQWGRYGSWGLREFMDQTTPKFDALMAWSNNNRMNNALALNAGQNRTVTFGQTVTLAASIQDDGNTNMVPLYEWTASGPGQAQFSNSRALDATVTFPVAGAYTLTLSADDGFLRNSDQLTVQVNAPQALAVQLQATPRQGQAPLNVTFGASASGGNPVNATYQYAWAFGDGRTSSLQNPTHSYAAAGNFNAVVTVSDASTSVSANVTITVNPPANSAPTASALAVETDEDTALQITLSGQDADGDPLSFRIVSGPSAGVLSGTPPNMTYTPNPDVSGSDQFSYVANDGTVDSNPATVDVTIVSVNDAPAINSGPGATPNPVILGGVVRFNVAAQDVDGDALTYAWQFGDGASSTVRNPSHTYTATGRFTAAVTVSDGKVSVSDSVRVTVNAPNNSAPTVQNISVETNEDAAIQITLTGQDADGDALTYRIVSPPTRGHIKGTPPNLIYTPDPDVNGSDQFSYVANDGTLDSSPANVNVTVVAINDAPKFTSAPSATPNPAMTGQEVFFHAGADDVEGDALTYVWNFGDGNSAKGSATAHAYATPGTYTVRVTVSDGNGGNASTEFSITINKANNDDDPPGTDNDKDGIPDDQDPDDDNDGIEDTLDPDRDGDGVANVIEEELGTNPNAATDAPLKNLLSISRLQGKSHPDRERFDRVTIKGEWPDLPANFKPEGQKILWEAGGVLHEFVLDAKGRARTSNGVIRVRRARSKDHVMQFQARLQGVLSRSLLSGLSQDAQGDQEDEGGSAGEVTLNLNVIVAGELHSGHALLTHTQSKRGHNRYRYKSPRR